MSAGQQLRDARLVRGLSVAEVASRTKISPKQLEALEAEQYGRLPGGVFVRGYVRAVAPVVGLNPDEVAAALRSDVEPPSDRPFHTPLLDLMPGPPRLHLADETTTETGPPRGQAMAVLIAFVAVVVAVIFWFGLQRSLRSAGDSAIVGAPPAQSAPASTPVGTSGR